MRQPFVFLDFEASSLLPGNFPIEVGWVFESGMGEAHLIRPKDDWREWSPESERIHGISRDVLEKDGRQCEWVARRIAAALKGKRVVASAPEWDECWLAMLLEAGGVGERFSVLPNVVADIEAAERFLDLPDASDETSGTGMVTRKLPDVLWEILCAATDAENLRPRVQHRALADAESLWRVWRDVGERARKHAVPAHFQNR